MPAPDEFTGERFLPECTGEIWAEHWHRYLFAARHVSGLDVLDIACGEGYGSALLAQSARSVTGVDIDPGTITKARVKYKVPGLRFETGSVSSIPLPDASFDCVVSFETLEHLAEQEEMLAEFRRVLRPGGCIVISTPNKVEYSEKRQFHNEFHVRELYEREFRELIGRHFGAQRWYGQRLLFNSAMWPLRETQQASVSVKAEWITVDDTDRALPDPMYFVVVAAESAASLPADSAVSTASLLADPEDSIYREYEATVTRSRTLEQLVADRERIVIERDEQMALRDNHQRRMEEVISERDAQLKAQAERALAMEQLIAERERVIVERDREMAAVQGAIAERERLIAERERVIAERDATLDAFNARIAHAERLIDERDAQLVASNERLHTAERLIAERERVVVERDAQLAASSDRQQALERLLADRERLIVERDAHLGALNNRVRDIERIVAERDVLLEALNGRMREAEVLIAARERIIVERDALLQATNERMTHAERLIAERDARIEALTRQNAELNEEKALVTRRAADMETLAAAQAGKIVDLRGEVVRRAGWRWWLSLPLRRVRGTVATSVGPDA